MDKASLDASVAYKIVKAARRQIDTGFITAKQLYDKRQNLVRLTLGSQNLNKLLGGGVGTQAIAEFVGEFGSEIIVRAILRDATSCLNSFLRSRYASDMRHAPENFKSFLC